MTHLVPHTIESLHSFIFKMAAIVLILHTVEIAVTVSQTNLKRAASVFRIVLMHTITSSSDEVTATG